MNYRRKGDKNRYHFLDARCIGRVCWAPGMYQHRSPLSCGGSRNTGSPDTPCCLNRAYRGCPPGPDGEHETIDPEHGKCKVQGTPLYQIELSKQRKALGWKFAGAS